MEHYYSAEDHLLERLPLGRNDVADQYGWYVGQAALEISTYGQLSTDMLRMVKANIEADPLEGMLIAEAVGLAAWDEREKDWKWR